MIKLGVSACLMGQKVRYDGKDKHIDLDKHFDPCIYQLIPICPEVEMGLPIPRSPIQIINNGSIKLVQVDNNDIDYTQQMQTWFLDNTEKLSQFSGFILKSKSPSCGNGTTPVHDKSKATSLSDGLFVRLLKKQFPNVIIIDEKQLNSTVDFLN